MDGEELGFARQVDRLGTRGLTQGEIAEQLGMTVSAVRYRLLRAGFLWDAEPRVRVSLTRKRLEDALAEGDLAEAAP